jgi:hypothetical protein
MERNYWIHRISHIAEISYPLLDAGYLSYGWSDFEEDGFIEGVRGENGWAYIDEQFMSKWGELSRGRYQLWNFIKEMKSGDWVVVPTYGAFSVYELLDDEPIMVKDIKDVTVKNWNEEVVLRDNDGYLIDKDNNRIDLGFARRVRLIQKEISRYDYADSDLTSRMKVRQTNVRISDLGQNVIKAIENFQKAKPIRFRNEINEVVPSIRSIIQTMLNPDKFENLIKWYFKRVGASSVVIPLKNSPDKVDYEDVDVIATFDLLKTIYYVQVKHYRGETSSWGAEQIAHLKELAAMKDDRLDDGYTKVYWLLSSSERFSEECINKAKETNVQLIDGNTFSSMLLDSGFLGVGDVL